MTDDTIFSNPTEVKPVHEINPDVDYFSELVGEGKKYADAKLLAKSRLEADNHIDRLEKENRGIRAELEKRLTLEELMTKITSQTKEPVAGANQAAQSEGSQSQPNTATGLTAEELQRLVDQRINQKVSEGVAKTNLDFVKSKMREAFGDNYPEALDAKCKELGVSREYLDRLAKEQPNVLLKLVDAKPKEAPVNAGSPSRSIDSSKLSMNNSNPADGFKGQKHYLALLKSDPATFWSHRTQIEMHNMAMKDPERYAAS